MSKPGKTGLRRIWNAMFYSLQGITAAWQHEAAFRQEAALCIIMIPLAFLVGDTAVERALLAGTCLLVLVTELLNSAIEAIVDRIGSEQHELSGRAKDIGSAAVFISLCSVGLTWGLIGYEHLFG
jgi:diacylglycerol kinase (ATP)